MYKNRKRLRLPEYDYSQPGAYFVTVCTKNHRCILGTVVGADAHIGPHPSAAPVGADAHIGPHPSAAPVGADAHIGPHPSAAPVGADAHIGPYVRLTSMGMTVEKYLRTVPGMDHYVIMPNHVHFIVHIAENEMCGPMRASAPTGVRLGDLVRSWKILVSKELGESMFQRSYYEHVIRNEREYIEIAEYIIGNPGKWCEDKYYFSDTHHS